MKGIFFTVRITLHQRRGLVNIFLGYLLWMSCLSWLFWVFPYQWLQLLLLQNWRERSGRGCESAERRNFRWQNQDLSHFLEYNRVIRIGIYSNWCINTTGCNITSLAYEFFYSKVFSQCHKFCSHPLFLSTQNLSHLFMDFVENNLRISKGGLAEKKEFYCKKKTSKSTFGYVF